jgi:hypothetical protein
MMVDDVSVASGGREILDGDDRSRASRGCCNTSLFICGELWKYGGGNLYPSTKFNEIESEIGKWD